MYLVEWPYIGLGTIRTKRNYCTVINTFQYSEFITGYYCRLNKCVMLIFMINLLVDACSFYVKRGGGEFCCDCLIKDRYFY